MLALAILGFATELAKVVNTMLKGVPPELRMAKALAWFHFWWPAGKAMLKLAGAPPEVIEQIEKLAAGEGK